MVSSTNFAVGIKIKFDDAFKALRTLPDDYSPLITSDNTDKSHCRDNEKILNNSSQTNNLQLHRRVVTSLYTDACILKSSITHILVYRFWI